MQHHTAHRILGRGRDQRRALLRSLAIALIENERIETTEARAKEVRPFIERLVAKSAEDSVARRRFVSSRLGGNERAVQRLFETIGPRFAERHGGYTRITKLPQTGGTGRSSAVIEFVA